MNALEGALPDAWSNLTSLQELHVGSNRLVGTLPSTWDAMTAMTRLDVSTNALSGTLPTIWWVWGGRGDVRARRSAVVGAASTSTDGARTRGTCS